MLVFRGKWKYWGKNGHSSLFYEIIISLIIIIIIIIGMKHPRVSCLVLTDKLDACTPSFSMLIQKKPLYIGHTLKF
jgi:hypothetical protein